MVNKSGQFRKKHVSFAQVSNTALRDNSLSLKAKGLLAVIESYLTLENFTLYKDFLMSKSKDGETSFRSAWKELKEHGYLIQYKMKDSETKQFYYEYEICDSPQVENQHVVTKPDIVVPHVENPLVDNLHNGNSTSVEPPLYNNNILNNNTLLINILQTNIDYDPVFIGSSDKAMVDNILEVMIDVLSSAHTTIKINNIERDSTRVKEVLMRVNMSHIKYVLTVIENYKSKITNMKNFIISVLYNSVLTLDSYYANLVNN